MRIITSYTNLSNTMSTLFFSTCSFIIDFINVSDTVFFFFNNSFFNNFNFLFSSLLFSALLLKITIVAPPINGKVKLLDSSVEETKLSMNISHMILLTEESELISMKDSTKDTKLKLFLKLSLKKKRMDLLIFMKSMIKEHALKNKLLMA